MSSLSCPSSQKRLRTLTTVRLLIDSASAILPSVCPSFPLRSVNARFIVNTVD